DHAIRLRARLGALQPFLQKQRAQLLHERATAALARVESEMGADVARAVAEAEDVPRIELDIAGDTNVQEVLKDVNHQFAMFREEYGKTQALFDESVDLTKGTHAPITDGIVRAVDGAARNLIKTARYAEELGDKVKKIDRGHPTV